jgi:hypothetical protein
MGQFVQMSEQQAGKAALLNELLDAVQAANLFGINWEQSEGLQIGLYGGKLWNGSALATIADSTTSLSASTTNYIEATTAGAVSKNTSAFTAGRIALYTVVTSASGISSFVDHRNFAQIGQHARFGAVESLLGGSTSYGAVPAKASINTTAVGNVGTGEDNLMTYSLPAGALSAAGKGVRITAWGTAANNADAKTLKLHFGSVAILTVSLTTSQACTWRIEAVVFSTGTDAQDYSAQLVQGGTATLVDVEGGSLTQDDGAAITIKCTGEATSNNDVVQEGLLVTFFN